MPIRLALAARSSLASMLARHISPRRAAFAGIFVVTGLGLLSVGATLPVIPRYVQGPIGAGDVSVGLVTGAFAITGLACRPLAGNLADRRGRRPVVIVGALLTAMAGALYFIPAGVPGLIVARLFLGAGEGMVYTAGSAWVVDLAPPERRGRIIGLYGLAIWGGLSLGPPVGELILRASSFEMVWAFAMAAPLLGAAIAWRIPDAFSNDEPEPFERRTLIERNSLLPGLGLALGTMGYAAVAAFLVLHLDEREIGHGAGVFAAFAATVRPGPRLWRRAPGPNRPRAVHRRGRRRRIGRAHRDYARGLLTGGDRRSARDGSRVLDAASLARFARREPCPRIAARRGDGHLYRVLRRRHRGGLRRGRLCRVHRRLSAAFGFAAVAAACLVLVALSLRGAARSVITVPA